MSRDSEDKETGHSQPKADNPFIKFRQFADEQIGSLLQGIVGLPSAFSKPQGNTRWADFDDELRLRDELQARQKELKESEARKAKVEPRTADPKDGVEIPVKKFPSWTRSSASNSTMPEDNRQMDDKVARDLPLYSPLSKSLFAHLDHGDEDGGASWKPIGSPVFDNHFFRLYADRQSTNKMKSLQQIMFNDLNVAPTFRSDYSLIPYLLFSPYSPLKLSSDAESVQDVTVRDAFPYCDAFEDLILVLHGRPVHTHGGLTSSRGPPRISPYFTPSAYRWFHQLQQAEILQQRETRTEQILTPRSITEQVAFPQPGKEGQQKTKPDDPQTEEDMYERFLRLVSPTSGNTGAGIFNSLFSDIEKEFSKEFKDLKIEAERALKCITDELKSINPEEERELRSLKEEFIRDSVPSLRQDLRESAGSGQLEDKSKAVSNPDKVISTSTTSEHTTNEDGSVETSVTVWKRFADGRETVITTTHTEDPARDEDGNPAERYPADTNPDEGKEEKKKETVKKGWFWN